MIKATENSLSKVFSSDYCYEIPPYQRPYAWTVEETSALFDDLIDFYNQQKDDSYFLGSIVLIKEEGNPKSEVIDGQQRLTTLTILLAAIASNLSGDMRRDLESYILVPKRKSQGIQSRPIISLRERDRNFFLNYIQKLNFDSLLKEDPANFDNESQINIQLNSRELLGKLKDNFNNDPDKLFDFGSFLVQRCFLVTVSTPNQQSAFRVFSILNDRGLDLLPTDIIKADIIGRIDCKERTEFTLKWEELEVQTSRNGFNDLFSHIRMIFSREKAKRSLLEEFKQDVLKNFHDHPKDFIDKILEPYAESYRILTTQQYRSTTNAEDVNRLLKWLNRIDNSDWLPPAILFISQKKNQPEYVLWFFTKLERLAAYLHICAKNVNERVKRYAKIIASLQLPHSMEEPPGNVELEPAEIVEMQQVLNSKIYELTPRRRNYIILRLDSFMSDGAASYNPPLLTIEHVLPQTVSSGSEWETQWPDLDEREYWVHRLANLVPLTQKRNSKAQNYDFEQKKIAYFSGKSHVSSYILTTQVLKTNSWTPSFVEQRQEELLKVLSDGWEL
ncbi:MAG: DUF262 domain-containing HNH endonuclease family protein [Deltaproteobacteria bacterium]|jgi:uncharacterized protein with ParB-like and HNH nuclease domain|nr:DUF262 domain-containing HNH endonuclease family protein [Deltaproteobacteria bacterium]